MNLKKYITHLLFVFFPLLSFSQSVLMEKDIPLNHKVKYGKLENGLSYYIMKNEKPEDKVELRLVVNAGSILEDDDQQGLAHFMEHMCFNGTKNFEKNELVDYLQSVGVKFGAHLNAYTSFDETVYILPIPSDDEKVLDNGLQILADWAQGALLTNEEIDKERGVVLEEYRLSLGANMRMVNKFLPKALYGSKYAGRLPIGKKEILEKFDYATLKRFYYNWYRPDLMAVIAVGDIDVQQMEEKINGLFSGLRNPLVRRERTSFEVPNHDETLIAIESDVEAAFSQIQVMFKDPKPVKPIKTIGDYKKFVTNQLFSSMLNDRLDELKNSSDPPFNYGVGFYGGSWARSKNAFQMYAGVSETNQLKGLKALLTEAARIKQHGFQASELERAKISLSAQMQQAFNEREKSKSENFANEYVSHFLENEPAPGIEWEFMTQKLLVPQITIVEVNGLINDFISEKNRVVILTGPEKEDLKQVSEDDIKDLLNEIDNSQFDPYVDEVVSTQLIEVMPKAGTIVKEEKNVDFDFTTLTLSNGMKVSYKLTDFKNDQILLSGFSYGGTSHYSDEEFLRTNLANRVISTSGVGNFSNVNLGKALAGKVVNVSPYIGELSEGISGSTTPKDLETMFQLAHLYFTAPREDPDAFNSLVQRLKGQYVNLSSNPQFYFSIEHGKFLQNNSKRAFHLPTEEEWKNTDYQLILSKYKEAFANPGDFRLYFVGNIEEEKFKNYVASYLASINGIERKDKIKDLGQRPPMAKEVEYRKGIDPKSLVRIDFTGETDFSSEDNYYLQSLGEILSIKLIEILREEKGGVYGAGANGSVSKYPYSRFNFSISFPCGPENVQELKTTALNELQNIINNGPEEKDLLKIKETQRKEIKEKTKQNGYWLNKLENADYYQKELISNEQILERIDKLSAKDIQGVGKKFLNTDPIIGILLPENQD